MSTIGKISSSLLSIPAELTVAAANLNFDFSLVKVEAPIEFHGVRDALSQFRRDEAESGASHVTARKLGALFESLVPPIPNLVKAYGERVSDISSKTNASSSESSSSGFGIFASQAGPDATNIWAAATSGRGAMGIQLLACMLARIWKEHEAISLWVELVECRRLEVNGSTVDGSNMAAHMAAQQTFSRGQLAAWDSSARSWIKTADSERRFQQTQLMLIIDNIELPVNSSSDLYDSVIKAWTSAMMAMEKLVQGIPQQIRDGAILLGISSWHLYPDMAVLSEVMTTVKQKDPLMNGSLLTFSVHTCPAQEDSNGVFWSLPMAHMRYYSPPVLSRGRLTSDTSRVSMDEFLIVILGMVVSPWLRTFCADIPRCCRLIRLLWDMTEHLDLNANSPNLNWLSMLSAAADRYLHASGIIADQYSKLLGLGIRSQSQFVKVDIVQPPAFGLTRFSTLLSLIDSEMVEEKIKFLRNIAQSRVFDSEDLVIRYTRQDQPRIRKETTQQRMYNEPGIRMRQDSEKLFESVGEPFAEPFHEAAPAVGGHSQEYASVIPSQRSAQKRSADGTVQIGKGHHRWI
ncbi:hypothetical protein Daus18300_004219 [Diaporthe australafricana]|uniref:Uncharacterized protein n=1 Tax=Diaporthe australafricana TaxID=127596 RepID=A0ABR3X9N6_9PEZI